MKLVVFGRTGQVATELARRLPGGVSARFLGRAEADLTDAAACAAAVEAAEADAIINVAAYTAVDRAESDEALAQAVNATAPAAMAKAAAAKGVPFLHVSTDYVFDGSGDAPFAPDHPTGPLQVYGRTKLAGEEGVRAAGGAHLILRTSWVVSAHGQNFLRTMLRLGRDLEVVRVVADQHGAPTPAAALADALVAAARAMAGGAAGGTHHFAGTPDTTWAAFAGEIMNRADLSCRIDRISTAAYPTPARRPLNSRLDCTSFTAAFGVARPDWRLGLDAILAQLGIKR